jgi:tRNA-dihydrouridine synthase
MLHKATLQLRGKDILIHGRGRRLKEQEAAYAWAEEVVGACADEIVSRNETINDLQEQLDLLHWQQWQAGLAADQPHEHASDAGKAVM